ncbi:2-keto-3-deoxy-L-rhamnonate aldolase RhmA [Bradyrhizobium liaoningense]
MANKVKEIWKSGKAVVNAWLAIPSGFSAEMIAQCGFDSVTVDMQHGVQDYLSMVQCFQAMDKHPITPMVRVPWNEPGIIGKVLDGGAYGVICPMVNTPQEARNLVSYSKYPPKGVRSNGPIRAGMYGTAGSYQKTANDEIVLLPMMETRTAVENMEAILDVEGIDGVYISARPISASPTASSPSSTAASPRSSRSTRRSSRNAASAASTPAFIAAGPKARRAPSTWASSW